MMMNCPYCSESIPEKSANCPKCKKNLNDKPQSMLSVEESNFLLNKYMDSIRREEILLLSSKKKWPKSRVILFASILFFVLFGTYSFMTGLGFAFCVIFCVPLAIVIIYAQNDKKATNIQSLTNSTEFIKQYFNSLNENRAKHLFQAIAPLGRTKETKPILFENVTTDTSRYDISQRKGYCKYWWSTFKGSGIFSRSAVIEQIDIAEEYDDKVIFNIKLNFSSYNKLLNVLAYVWGPIFAGKSVIIGEKVEAMEIKKTILKHNNKWYVAEGELQGNLDFATFKK